MKLKCLFNDVDLPLSNPEEHAVPRSIGGRIRSRRISSGASNNRSSNGIDDLQASAYSSVFNFLAPLLTTEHALASLDSAIRGNGQYRLHPGGELGIHGTRIDARDKTLWLAGACLDKLS